MQFRQRCHLAAASATSSDRVNARIFRLMNRAHRQICNSNTGIHVLHPQVICINLHKRLQIVASFDFSGYFPKTRTKKYRNSRCMQMRECCGKSRGRLSRSLSLPSQSYFIEEAPTSFILKTPSAPGGGNSQLDWIQRNNSAPIWAFPSKLLVLTAPVLSSFTELIANSFRTTRFAYCQRLICITHF